LAWQWLLHIAEGESLQSALWQPTAHEEHSVAMQSQIQQ